ncbi:MAG: hypothetical protein NVS2B9_13290 [Myxococcales bacterium]
MSQFFPATRSNSYRSESTTLILGKVLSLVAVALAFTALGTHLGRHLAFGTARAFSFAGFGMLLIASFGGRRFRVGTFAIIWLYLLALAIGIGLGPVIAYFAHADQSALTKAAGGTALTVLGAGALGFTISRDLSPWLRPLSLAVLVAVVAGAILLLLSSGPVSPIFSGIIYIGSTLLILVDFNVLRRVEDEAAVIPLATGIFVSIINIFISLLNLFSSE